LYAGPFREEHAGCTQTDGSLIKKKWRKAMQKLKGNRIVRYILFSNGIIDQFAALALFFPVLKLPLPGDTNRRPYGATEI